MAADIEFFFDFSSPYAYFASTQVDALAARHGRKVQWRPILLGVVFRSTGAAPLTAVPIKGDYARHDFKRTARLHGIDFNLPDPFPIPTQAAARAMLWTRASHGDAQAIALAKALFRAYFVDNLDISAPESVVKVAVATGLDAQQVAAGLDSAAVRAELKAGTDEAMQRGVCGAPFLIVDGEPWWGFDRFGQVEDFLSSQQRAQAAPAGKA
ncbi:MAG: h16 [Paucimonas sp.]|nr:h16 [Paucimonas sp.]